MLIQVEEKGEAGIRNPMKESSPLHRTYLFLQMYKNNQWTILCVSNPNNESIDRSTSTPWLAQPKKRKDLHGRGGSEHSLGRVVSLYRLLLSVQ